LQIFIALPHEKALGSAHWPWHHEADIYEHGNAFPYCLFGYLLVISVSGDLLNYCLRDGLFLSRKYFLFEYLQASMTDERHVAIT